MNLPGNNKFLFFHIMKTGGTSFSDMLVANFSASEKYPEACLLPNDGFMRGMEAYVHVPQFIADVNTLSDEVRMVRAHVPYAVRSMLKDDYVALTILRDPVDRTISYLKHARKNHPEHYDMGLEEIYEDLWLNESFIRNHQTKFFSMSIEESLSANHFPEDAPKLPTPRELKKNPHLSPEIAAYRKQYPTRFLWGLFATCTGRIIVDSERLAIAKDNLAAVDLVGVTANYDYFVKKLVAQYGWKVSTIPHSNAGENETISPDFRRRIIDDNAFDMELYEYARTLST